MNIVVSGCMLGHPVLNEAELEPIDVVLGTIMARYLFSYTNLAAKDSTS